MKVSLVEICDKCGHAGPELLEEKFQKWQINGAEAKIRLMTTPLGAQGPMLLEMKIVTEEQDRVPVKQF